jgi:hypothetical protein
MSSWFTQAFVDIQNAFYNSPIITNVLGSVSALGTATFGALFIRLQSMFNKQQTATNVSYDALYQLVEKQALKIEQLYTLVSVQGIKVDAVVNMEQIMAQASNLPITAKNNVLEFATIANSAGSTVDSLQKQLEEAKLLALKPLGETQKAVENIPNQLQSELDASILKVKAQATQKEAEVKNIFVGALDSLKDAITGEKPA